MHQTVADLLRNGGVILYTSPRATVVDAIEKMAQHNVGSILVLEGSRDLVGIFTERDLLRRVILKGLDPAKTTLADVMTKDVIVVTADTPRHEVMQLMNRHHCRHIPVAAKDRLLGVISLRDLLRYENREKEFEIEQLRQYILQSPVHM